MKSRLLTCIVSIIALAALAVPAQLSAQKNQNHKHHHYQLIDLGTFGGPTSRNDGINPALNNEGTVIGVADTSNPDPFYPNFNPLMTPSADPYTFKAFQWENGQLVALDSLPGGYSASSSSISKNGLIAGQAINGALDPITGWPEENAVFWYHGRITDLGTLGGYESASSGFNSRGQVAGFSSNAIPDPYSLFGLGTQVRAFLWDEKNGMQDIGTLGGPDAVSVFINDRGQIAGASYTNSVATFDPFLWEGGTMIDLGSLGGTSGFEGDGVGLNSRGQVVGSSNLPGDVYYHPFLWTKPGPMQDLGTFGGNFGMANALNDAGEVVGWATNAGDQALFAFLWQNGIMTNLGVLPGKLCSYAHQINAEGQVTGGSDDDCNDGNSHAFLWENGGPMVDMNDLVSGADMTLGGATGINDRGEITGTGVLANGDVHVFLLIPCDEHHPGIEGCDYTMVDARAVQSTAAAVHKALGPIPQPIGWRMMPWPRGLGAQQPARMLISRPPISTASARISADTVTYDLLGDHTLAPQCWPLWRCHGSCEVNQFGKLTGLCEGSRPPYYQCVISRSNQCPRGARSGHTEVVPCNEIPDRIDTTRNCSF